MEIHSPFTVADRCFIMKFELLVSTAVAAPVIERAEGE